MHVCMYVVVVFVVFLRCWVVCAYDNHWRLNIFNEILFLYRIQCAVSQYIRIQVRTHTHTHTHTHIWMAYGCLKGIHMTFCWLTWNAVNCTMNANDMMVIFFKMRHFSPGFKMTFSLSDVVSASKPAFGCK